MSAPPCFLEEVMKWRTDLFFYTRILGAVFREVILLETLKTTATAVSVSAFGVCNLSLFLCYIIVSYRNIALDTPVSLKVTYMFLNYKLLTLISSM